MINLTKSFPVIILCTLSGCAQHHDYEGTGEYFELAHTHVIERDLTEAYAKPTMQTLKQTRPITVVRQEQLKNNQLGEIFKGETYESALKRWLNRSHYKYVAWSLDDDTTNALEQKSASHLSLHGTLASRVAQLGIHLEKTIVLTQRPAHHLAAIHQYKTRAFITLAHGVTFKDAVKNMVTDYGHIWGEDNSNAPSYRAHDDYAFAASYPIVTERGNLTKALDTLLDGYPVQAQILQSTGQVFIEDNK